MVDHVQSPPQVEHGATRTAQPEAASIPPLHAPLPRPQASDRALPPVVVLGYQRSLGNRAVQRMLAPAGVRAGGAAPAQGLSRLLQRVKTPDLPASIPKGEETAVYRSQLILLQAQLTMTKVALPDQPAKDIALKAVGVMIDMVRHGQAARITPLDLQQLTQTVNALTPNAASGVGSVLEQLKPAEIPPFTARIEAAQALIDAALSNGLVLAETFGAASATGHTPSGMAAWFSSPTPSAAEAKFRLIKSHLNWWKTLQATQVRISRTEVGYVAANQNLGNASTLALRADFLIAGDPVGLAATLVHEASHGVLGTKDHGYIGAPYFSALKDSLALDNADHYKYAVLRAHGSLAAPQAAGGIAGDVDIATFQRAKGLSYFRSNKIWMFLTWMIDTYGGKDYVRAEALQQHAQAMGLPLSATGPNAYRSLRQAHAQAMSELYAGCKGYLVADMDLHKAGTTITMTPKGGQRAIDVADVVGKNVESMSKQIILAVAKPLGLPAEPDWDLTIIGDAFLAHLFQANDPRYHIGDNDKALHTILSQP